jgi:hypothetical protein
MIRRAMSDDPLPLALTHAAKVKLSCRLTLFAVTIPVRRR